MNIEQQKRWFPFFLVLCEMATYLSTDMYLPALPAIARDFGATQDMVQYTLAAWFIGSGSLQLFIGPLADRYGRKKVLLSGAVIFVLSSIACTLTDDIVTFTYIRFLQGTTVCTVLVAGYAVVHELFDQKKAIQLLTWMGAITILAPALGPILGALIESIGSWRNIFHVLAAVGVFSLCALSVCMPETNPKPIPINLRKITQDYWSILKNKHFMRYTGSSCILVMGFFAWIVESPFILIETYQHTQLFFGVAQLVVFSGFILGAKAAKYTLARTSIERLLHLGFSIAFASALFLLFSAYCLNEYAFTLSMLGVALGSSMTFGSLNRLAVDSCQEPMGSRVAMYWSIRGMAGGLAGILVTVFGNKTLPALAWLCAICVGIGVVVISIKPRN